LYDLCPICTIMVSFTCFESICIFRLCEPKHDRTMKILRPYGSKKVSKEAQRHATRTNCGQNHSGGSSWKKQQKEQMRTTKVEPTRVCSWWCLQFVTSRVSLSRLDFFAAVQLVSVFDFCGHHFHHKCFTAFIHLPTSIPPSS